MGYPHPDYLLQDLSSRQVSEWVAFFAIEGPIGEERDDLRAGIIASTIANCHRGKDSKPFRPGDFMPFAEREEEQQTDIGEAVRAAFSQFKRA